MLQINVMENKINTANEGTNKLTHNIIIKIIGGAQDALDFDDDTFEDIFNLMTSEDYDGLRNKYDTDIIDELSYQLSEVSNLLGTRVYRKYDALLNN